MAKKLRWGIIGCGRIGGELAGALAISETSELVAVASRSKDKAEQFGRQHGAARCYGSYEELVKDDGIDVAYIATPQTCHAENTILCLQHGKHVLCEKPFAINAAQAEAMIRVAEENALFLMEAMWTRFLPSIIRLKELIAEGTIGEIREVHADFGIRVGWNPESRILNADLGGGALLDVGIYPVSLASMLLGKPEQISSVAHVGETGVDEQFVATMRHAEGRLSVSTGSIRTGTHRQAWIFGTDGQILLEPGWWGGSTIHLMRPYHKEQIEFPFASNRYVYQVDEVAHRIADGETESEVMPLAETLELVRTMDTLRSQWGMVYPCEKD